MGVGRRMKKQGPPEPLDEAFFTSLKRKSNKPFIDSKGESQQRSKKRRTIKDDNFQQNLVARDNKNTQFKKAHARKKGLIVPEVEKPAVKVRKSNRDPFLVTDDEISDKKSITCDKNVTDDSFEGLSESQDSDRILKDEFFDSGSEVYDSADDQNQGTVFSEDEDQSDADDKLNLANIAGMSRILDEKLAKEAAEAEAELQETSLQTNIVGERPHILPDSDEENCEKRIAPPLAPDLQLLRTRINDLIRVLEDFSKLAESGRSRSDYISQLLKDICTYYGYSPYLAEKLFNLFPVREAFAFFEANESPRPIVIRTNTLRTHRRELAQALMNRGVTLEPVGKWSKVGLQIFESPVPIGATPEYLAGHYILQAASSFLPVMALAPQDHERILDMAAAPGGKTTYISALIKNTGCIFANDSNKVRAKGLIGNIHRLGARNIIVCNYDARSFPKVMGGFDRVLLDAPCSGTGVIAKDPSVKTNKLERDFLALPHLQKQLLLAAIDSVNHGSKTGGYIVYSTCSVTIEENESVVQYALQKRPNVKLVETGLAFGKEGFTAHMSKKFDPSLRMTRRYYPHVHNIDGFFVAKFRKTGPTPNALTKTPDKDDENVNDESVKNGVMPELKDNDRKESKSLKEFGGWDESEDELYMERARRRNLKRRGINPRAHGSHPKKLT